MDKRRDDALLIRTCRAAAAAGALLVLAGCLASAPSGKAVGQAGVASPKAAEADLPPPDPDATTVAIPVTARTAAPVPPPGNTAGGPGDPVDFGVLPDTRPGTHASTPPGDPFGISLVCPQVAEPLIGAGSPHSGACGPDPYARIPIGPGLDDAVDDVGIPRDAFYFQLYSTRLAGDIEMSVHAKNRAALRWVLPFSP